MEFVVRALRGWAVPLVLPIPQAWQVFKDGRVLDKRVEEQLRALGHDSGRATALTAAATGQAGIIGMTRQLAMEERDFSSASFAVARAALDEIPHQLLEDIAGRRPARYHLDGGEPPLLTVALN